MTAKDFIQAYEAALASQNWQKVEPLIHPQACITFSNGQVNQGIRAIETAFSRNFALIKNETYLMTEIEWVTRQDNFAVYIFKFTWSGFIENNLHSGAGRETATLIREDKQWLLLAEHLGAGAS